jgi:hypothetical protein
VLISANGIGKLRSYSRALGKVEEFIRKQFPFSQEAQDYYFGLWAEFAGSGLADKHFIQELTSGALGKFEQRAWEMILARRLRAFGHTLTSKDEGPDFHLIYKERTVWIEAISPTPAGIPSEWLEPPLRNRRAEAIQVPFDAILLRWTAALKEKREILVGRTLIDKATGEVRNELGYVSRGIVGNEDAYVIAIDPCQLTANRPLDEGVSRLPIALEAVFPLGPIAVPIERDGKFGETIRTERYMIKKQNKADVPTDNFLNPSYMSISAIVSASTVFAPAESLHLTVVHNPLAKNQLPLGLFGPATSEWTAEEVGDGAFELRKHG